MRFSKLAVPAIALAITSPMFVYSAWTQAADKPSTAAARPASGVAATPQPQEQAMLTFSEAGNAAMRDIRGARFAIFNGDPRIAKQLMESAKTAIAKAEKEAPVFDTTSTMLVGGKVVGTTAGRHEVNNVPVDGQLVLADNFMPTPEKKAHIEKANEHFRKGEHAKALEELRLGEIDVNFTRSWMPIAQSKRHLDQALKLVGDGKYYEANLALKAIEDSITVDSVTLSDLPKRAAG